MELFITTIILSAVILVSSVENRKFGSFERKFFNVSKRDVEVSSECFNLIDEDQLKCMTDSCIIYSCDDGTASSVCKAIWYQMDCITGLVDRRCLEKDQQWIRDQYKLLQKQHEAGPCKFFPRNSSKNNLPNAIMTVILICFALILI
jgi:hypothetical protein